MRGVAAIAVFNSHLPDYFSGIRSANVGLVVDFFFLLSGFVLSYAYQDRLTAGFGALRFMMARLLRLYPLYLLGLIIGAADTYINWRWAGDKAFFTTLGMNFFFLPPPPAFSSNSYNLFPLDFPVWSLFYELIANLVFAVLARRLNNVVLGLIILTSLVGLVATGLHDQTLDLGVRPGGWYGGLARVMFSFFAGIALFRLWRAKPITLNVHPLPLLCLMVLPLLFMPAKPYEWVYDLAVIAVYFPILLTIGSQSQTRGVWTGICAALGAISYPLYVLHAAFFDWIHTFANKAFTAAAPWSGLGLLAILLVLSWCLDAFVDRPLRKALSRAFFRMPAKPGAAK